MSTPFSSSTPGKTIKLRDGRSLGYAEFGDPEGKPIFFFHGYPGSRLEGKFFAEAAKKAGARIISSDRPGSGLSDFKPGRVILDWPDDVIELGSKVLRKERAFNEAAGFTAAHDRLPEFMKYEPLPPHNTVFDVPDEELDAVYGEL